MFLDLFVIFAISTFKKQQLRPLYFEAFAKNQKKCILNKLQNGDIELVCVTWVLDC